MACYSVLEDIIPTKGDCDPRLEDHFKRYMENKSPITMQEFLYGCPPDSLSDSNLAGWVTPSKNILKAMNTLALPDPQFANLSLKDGNDDDVAKDVVDNGSVIVISSESEEEMEQCNDLNMSGIEPLGDIETSGSES